VFLFLERPLLTSLDQSAVIYPLLKRFGITEANLGFFVLDNAINNDTTLAALLERIGFDPNTKRLRYIGHVLNSIAEAYCNRNTCYELSHVLSHVLSPDCRNDSYEL
jgi:hypothetical protein